MHLIFFYLFLIFYSTSCATIAVYEKVVPNDLNWASSKDVKSARLLTPNLLQIQIKSWFSTDTKCLKLDEVFSVEQVYSYSLTDCSNSQVASTELSIDSDYKSNWLPLLDKKKSFLDLSLFDKRSSYTSVDRILETYLKESNIQKAYMNKKMDRIYFFELEKYCTILARSAGKDLNVHYHQPYPYESNCPKSYDAAEFTPIKIVQNPNAEIIMNFADGTLAFQSEKANTKSNPLRYLLIVELTRDNNYFYIVLFPFAIAFDIVTSPFQFLYFWMLGAGMPAK